ncbi:MAG: response regulator transcription factor [bacterium]
MKILLIEDDKDMVKFLKDSLRPEYYEVDAIMDGEKGSFAARTNDYDLIILDNCLPSKEGSEVCKEVRAAGKTTPILMLSVVSESEKKVQLLDCGADDYLTKPFCLSELLARIRALIRRPKIIQGHVIKLDDLTMDIRQQEVYKNKKEIHLTRKEFMLLQYFLENIGTVLSRGMIMEHVWDMNADPFSNTIESHILSLRKKIDINGKKKLIRTVPGRGYKISAK